MGKRLYCGNLPFSATADEIKAIFGEGGRSVTDVHIVMDRETGRSRGFAFIELASDQEAESAVQAVNGRQYGGRALAVKEALERAPRPGGAPGGFGGPPRGPRPAGRPGFGGPRPPGGPPVDRRPPYPGGGGGYGGGGRGGFGRNDFPPEPMLPPEPVVTQPDYSRMPEGGYAPPEDVDYREVGDRGKRGRDRRGGRRRGGDDFGGPEW